MRERHCADVGMKDCKFVAQGKDETEVMKKAGEHAKTVHGMATIPQDVERKTKAAIRDSGALKDAEGKPLKSGESKLK